MNKKQKGSANTIVVVVIVTLIGAIGYFAFIKKSGPVAQLPSSTQTPSTTNPNPPQAKVSTPTPTTQTNVKEISICDINVGIPSFVKTQLTKDEDFTPSGTGGTKLIGCKYQTTGFSILVLDRNTISANEEFWQAKFKAFDRYQQSQNVDEIKNFSTTDIISTSIKNQQLYKNLNNNTVSYTAEIYQDIPGFGVYQKATEINNRYLVYITYNLFNIADKAWSNYFAAHWSSQNNNETQIFNEYMAIKLKDNVIINKINELNNITLNIK